MEMAIAAVALGAVVIEKHLTLNRDMEGPDHRASLEPPEFASLVRAVRNVEAGLGDGIKKPAPSEIPTRVIARRSIVARWDIDKNKRLSPDCLAVKRPGSGIPPEFIDMLVGMKTKRVIGADEMISWQDLEWTGEDNE